MEQRFSIVCVAPIWEMDLPTNRQQIMLRAARRGHRVLFVETGYFWGRHLWRLLSGPERRSLIKRLVASEEVAPGIRVRKALNLLPWGQKYTVTNSVNCMLTAALLRLVTRTLPQPVVLWLYDPFTASIARRSGEALAVYDCVDDYVEQAIGARRRALAAVSDTRAAKLARLVFATTSTLYERKRRINASTHLVPNVGDYEHFVPAADRAFAADDVRDLRRPVLGFAGNFLTSKVDLELLEAVAHARPQYTLLLVGPARSDSEAGLERLARLPNVVWVGAKPYDDVPRYVAAFDVGLIPYVANAYTQSCFPLKLYEYLAAGKPVVASGLPELSGMEPHVTLVSDGAPEFVSQIDAALGRLGKEESLQRSAIAAGNSWETRTDRLLQLVAGELAA